jgi:hypothetical protein
LSFKFCFVVKVKWESSPMSFRKKMTSHVSWAIRKPRPYAHPASGGNAAKSRDCNLMFPTPTVYVCQVMAAGGAKGGSVGGLTTDRDGTRSVRPPPENGKHGECETQRHGGRRDGLRQELCVLRDSVF